MLKEIVLPEKLRTALHNDFLLGSHQTLHNAYFDAETLILNLRKKFEKTFWMECSDMYQEDESLIIIAAEPLAGIEITDTLSGSVFKGDQQDSFSFENDFDKVKFVDEWINNIKPKSSIECRYNGVLGYCSYNAVQVAEDITFITRGDSCDDVPLLRFNLYKYIFVCRKSKNEIVLINNHSSNEAHELYAMKKWLAENAPDTNSSFNVSRHVDVDCTEQEFLDKIKQGKLHCMKGDVFQVVLSRKFSRQYQGDPWTFFFELKKINVSPFMFCMDESDFVIAGTSPEIHFMAIQGEGCINPIAGTYARSGSPEQEALAADRLMNDPKENSEHVMLVDLARNDLNKIATNVHVSQFKHIEKYRSVMHIVSRVKGIITEGCKPFKLILDVFPAGTLSGAPKYRAMEIIDQLENSSRSFYGGLLGWIGFNDDVKTCIVIRSALFKNNTMTYRAGAGVVESSVPEMELQEVDNKLKSISIALERFLS